MVEKIGALADDAARTVAHRRESGLAGLLDQLLRDLRPTAGEQVRSARVVAFLDAVEGIVEAADFRRIRLDPCRNAGEYRFNSGVPLNRVISEIKDLGGAATGKEASE